MKTALLFLALLLSACANVSDYDRIVANEALPAQVRLAVDREPESRKLFQMLRDDCRMFATPQGIVDLQTYAKGVVMFQEGRWQPETFKAVCTFAKLVDNDGKAHGNGGAAAPELLNLARGIQEGLSPEVPSTQPTRF